MRHHESIQERVSVARRVAVATTSIAAFVAVTVFSTTSGSGEVGFAFAVVVAPVVAAIVAAIHVAAIRAASGVEVASVGVAKAMRRVGVAVASGLVVTVVCIAFFDFVFGRAPADASAFVQIIAVIVSTAMTGATIFAGVSVAFVYVAVNFFTDVIGIAFMREES